MRYGGLYRALIRLLPLKQPAYHWHQQAVPQGKKMALEAALRRHKAIGGALLLFDEWGITDRMTYGYARAGLPVEAHTAFRLASVSKLVTAAGILAMRERGLVDLDRDAGADLPYSLRHPKAPGTPITLRMLLAHTSGIRDGKAYTLGLAARAPAGEVLRGDSHGAALPGEGAQYSNFAFGLAACLAEAQSGLSLQQGLSRFLFEPLGMKAAYYPALLKAPVADARRILPPRFRPNYDGAARQAVLPDGWDRPNAQAHYTLAQGACCMDADSLATLGRALMQPGFFTEETLREMRKPHASLGERDPHLSQGLGLFILRDEGTSPRALYGHQGMAYGAVNMMFLDLETRRGLISLTTGVSEARTHIMADVNRALLKAWQSDA